MRGADLLIKSIIAAGIDKIFTLSGNQIMPIFDAAIDLNIELIHCRHEAAAVFMADGYAQTSGKTGIALVTAAPGFANALGPLYSIKATQSPVILLSGDSPLNQRSLKPFQELDQPSISKGLVKNSWRAERSENLGRDIAKAVSITKTGRPGPVHIALPFDILNEEVSDVDIPNIKNFKQLFYDIDEKNQTLFLKLLSQSNKPLILTGPSLAESRNLRLYEKINSSIKIPIVSMSSPRGANDPTQGKIKTVLKEADFIISIDKDFDFTLGFGSKERIGADSVAIFSTEKDTIVHATNMLKDRLKLKCDADPISSILYLSKINYHPVDQYWNERVKSLLIDRPKSPSSSTGKMKPQELCNIVVEGLKDQSNTIFISDGGEFGQWAQASIPISKLITNGLSGAIGGATPQAIGASFANPNSTIISFMGDGTAGFQISEWETARRFNLPIIYIIGNDRRWGAEVEIQIRDYGKERAQYCMLDNKTRYDIIAKGMGCQSFFVNTISSLKDAIKIALSTKKTTVIDIEMEGLPAPSY